MVSPRLHYKPSRALGVEPGTRRRGSRDGDETRDLLADVAEELFGRYGPEAVSIRSVNAAAGLAPAAVHYHFGTKEALIRAVLLRRGTWVTLRQFELLDALEASRQPPTPRQVVRAMADPVVELLERDGNAALRWVKVVAWLAQARHPVLFKEIDRPGGLNERLERQIRRALPDVDEDHLLLVWQIAGSALIRLFADADTPAAHRRGDPTTAPSRQFLDEVVDFVVRGLEGVQPQPTARPRRAGARRPAQHLT